MREHMGLYRGKRIDNGEWIEGNFWLYGDARIFGDPNAPYGCLWHAVDPDTVGECTGIKDKNGKLIFEGDIVRESFEGSGQRYVDTPFIFEGGYEEYDFYGFKIGKVTFGGYGAFVTSKYGELWIDGEKADYTPTRRKRLAAYRSEIIGNIHDNPELKGGEAE